MSTQISVLDRVDGGLSVFLHVPGYKPADKLRTEDIAIQLYVPQREYGEGGSLFARTVANLVQEFGDNLARAHLSKFQSRCISEGVIPPPQKEHSECYNHF